MKLSRSVAYAIHATLELADDQSNGPVPCSDLASRGKMPARFLLQILRTLVMRGILHSTRGVEGGYYLARPPDEITLLDIVDAFENPVRTPVPDLPGVPPRILERLMSSVQKTTEAARNELRQITVADLARGVNGENN